MLMHLLLYFKKVKIVYGNRAMNYKKLLFRLLIVGMFSCETRCHKERNCSEFDKFAHVFVPPPSIEKELLVCSENPECAFSLYRQSGRWQGPTPLYHKGDAIERLVNAVRMKKCIEKYNLYLLDVADKYLWQARGTHWGKEWRIFARLIQGECAQFKISSELLEQLMVLAEETGFNDWGASGDTPKKTDCLGCNWIWDSKRKKLVCIDTEDRSFFDYHYCKRDSLHKLRRWENLMDVEAIGRFYQRIAELENSREGYQRYISLPYNSAYDDEIDFEKVKKEYWSGCSKEGQTYCFILSLIELINTSGMGC